MSLKKVRLGDLIENYSEKCNIPNLNNIQGINKEKEFIISRQVGEDTSNYKIVYPNSFACNLMHIGRDAVLPISLNIEGEKKIVSPAYITFNLVNENTVTKEFLFLYLKSSEKDRYFWFHCDSSVRDGMDWDDFCDIELQLPDLETQQKYVNVYTSLVENQKTYERGLDDLKLVCDGYIEQLRKEYKSEKIGKYINLKRNKNLDEKIKNVYGVSNMLKFVTASSSVDKDNLSDYKIVEYRDIAYVPTTHMKIWACAISSDEAPFVVSPIYEVFEVNDKEKLCPEFLFIWLCRTETIRYAYYNSWGSARENFVFDDMCEVKIPIPPIEIQESISKIYKVYNKRKEINERLKEQIKDICPILIKGSIDEAKKGVR